MAVSKIQVTVEDMKCNGCEDTIQDGLRRIDGVERVSANHIEGTVEVVGSVDPNDVVSAINKLGFTASR
ncbi:heavy-metal-associated domain-containing protein [Haloarchaeobius sp. DFWS5]|uniref:heavy-metal-associated domain-containing protein n=1 Tax=Haloarchaeobius sp. DFWS5 TaxID=3446114 RepID=UPI003EC138FA